MFNKTYFVKNNAVAVLLLTLLAGSQVQAETTTFSEVCSSCHTGGFKGWLTGAPDVDDKNEWKKFVERDSIEKMRKIVINGSDDHKVKGGCTSCTDEQVIETIEYMMTLVK
jgi:cytochrome c5